MATTDVRLSVLGRRTNLALPVMTAAVEAFGDLLQGLTGDADAWQVVGLEIGSQKFTVRGPSEAAEAMDEGLASLAGNAMIPTRWPLPAVRAVTKFAAVRNHPDVERVQVRIDEQVRAIDEGLLANARASLEPRAPSLGAVHGRLVRINLERKEVGIRDDFRDETVSVHFDTSLRRSMIENLDELVHVWGEVRRAPTGQRTIIAERIQRQDPIPERPVTADELVGLFAGDARAGVDALTWQRRQRNG